MATPSASLLRAFARYMKEHPDVPEEQVIEVFAGTDRSEEEEALVLATPESCITTCPQPIPKRTTISTGYDFLPPTPDSFSEAVLPPSLNMRPLSPTLEMYLGQTPSNDPVFPPEDCQPSETKVRSTPNIQLDASFLWDYASGSTIHTLGSTAAASMEQHIDAPSPFDLEAFLSTATSRISNDSTGATGAFDSACFEPQQDGSSLYSEHDDTANLSGISRVFDDFEYNSPPIVLSNKRRAAVPVQELHRREAEKALNSSLGRTKAPKRISTGRSKDHDQDQFPSSNKQTKPQQSGNSQTRTGSSTWGRGVYVRPRHPRVLCPLCPDGHTGFRGDHEYRRHHERIHARRKRVWVVRDKSGSGLLSRCKACSTDRHYGVDYNATAHLKRQHFNPEKTPGIVAPDNIRDWIEAIEVEIEGEPRKRGGKKSKAQAAKEKESRSLESSERVGETEQESEKGEYPRWDGEEEEEEGDGGEFEVTSNTDQGGGAINPVASYVQQRAAEREQKLRIASKLSTEALLSGPDNWTQFDEHFAFAEKTARGTDGATVEVSQHTFSHAAVSASGSTMINTPSPDLYHFNRHLLQEHRLPHDFSVGVGGCTVSPSDLCMIPLGDNSPF